MRTVISLSVTTCNNQDAFAHNKKPIQENKMKALRQFCAAFVLTLMLAASASAGQMTTGIADPPPPAPPTSTATTGGDMSTGAAGNMSTTVAGEMSAGVTATDPVTGVALNLLLNVLSLF